MISTIEAPTLHETDIEQALHADPWAVIVWNDDVNTFAHVIRALVEILGHTPTRAEQLANRVHHTGKAVVAVRPRDEAVSAVQRLHVRGIQATAEPA
jgi:ATP-dependent Clp protease adaptor protein ClpS